MIVPSFLFFLCIRKHIVMPSVKKKKKSYYCVLMKCNQTTMNSVVDKPCVLTDIVCISISSKAFDIIHKILISCNLR